MTHGVVIPRSRVGGKFFVFSALILAVQLIVGLAAAAEFVWPNLGGVLLPFNIVRMLHINALVVSLLAGFMGATYFLMAEETEGSLASEGWANLSFWLLAAGVGAVVLGYLYMGFSGHYSPLWSEGREYIEAPRWADVAIVAVLTLFLWNVFRTVLKGEQWNALTGMLLLGLVGLAGFYLAGMRFFGNLALDMFFWWWVIHLWVEGAWELIAAALYALLLVRLFDFPRERATRYVYIEAGLALFTGILGTGHHYYWIGTPRYWFWVGGIFSALEPLPIVVMVLDAVRIRRERKAPEHPNRLAQTWLLGSVVLHFFGAGLWGFVQTFPQTNRWTHGTQITAAHGHLAFYGAYGMLVIGMIYYALPRLKFGSDAYDQRRGNWAFWWMTSGMVVMTLALTGAGIVQVFLERIAGLPFMETQAYLDVFYRIRFWGGAAMIVGLALFLLDVFALKAPRGGIPAPS